MNAGTRGTKVSDGNADPSLAYELELPAGWQRLAPSGPGSTADPGELRLLGRFGSPGGRSLVEILTQVLEYELSAADWLDAWLVANGFEVRRNLRTLSSAGFDACVVAIGETEGRSYVYHFTTFKNGHRLYLVSGLVTPDEAAAFEPEYARVRDSFRLLASSEPTAEALRTMRLDHVVPARVSIPASWIEDRDASVGPDQDSVAFRNRALGPALAQIHVFIGRPEAFRTHGEIAEHVLAAAQRLSARPLPEVPLAPVQLLLADAREGNAFLEAGSCWVRVRLTVARLGPAWVSVLLVGLTPVPDPLLLDAMNNRAYEIARTTLEAERS